MRRRPLALAVLLAIIPAGLARSLPAQHGHDTPATSASSPLRPRTDLGTYHYRITTASDRAQAWFDQGLRWFWAFNHAEAAQSFRLAEREDPTCALCAWGVALSVGPNINAPMEPGALDTARAAILRAQERVAHARPIEQAFIEALAVRYTGDDRAAADTAYLHALHGVRQRFPEDHESRVLLADAIMNLSPWNYWERTGAPRPFTQEAITTLQDVLASDATHPGACHLFIHLLEARDPSRALPCAEQLAALMPGAGHLVHMPAHVYIRVGRYADAIRSNTHALQADEGFLEGDRGRRRGLYGSGYYPHNAHFLAFAATMMGDSRLALRHAARAVRAVDPAVARATPWVEAIASTLHTTLVTFGRWDEVLRAPLPPTSLRFATGMAFYARGVAFTARRRWAEAHALHDSVRAIAANLEPGDNRSALEVAAMALAGELALAHGKPNDAVRAFEQAVALEDALAYNEPPTWYYPMRQSLGKALLAARRPVDAERAFRQDLDRFPENGWSLFGLSQSLLAQGRRREAREVTARFTRAWSAADVQLRSSRF